MGLLDKLWDDTVAGPRPDAGLGRLRKHAGRPAAVKINDAAGDAVTVVPPTTPAAGEEAPVRVTRSIMIKRPAGCPASPRSAASTPPASPAGSTPPISPFAGAGGRFRRKSSSDAFERATPVTTSHPPLVRCELQACSHSFLLLGQHLLHTRQRRRRHVKREMERS